MHTHLHEDLHLHVLLLLVWLLVVHNVVDRDHCRAVGLPDGHCSLLTLQVVA